jgi:type VI secretion system secreted protein VgrG
MPSQEAIHTLAVEGVTTDVRVMRFEGYEGISQLFEITVTIGVAATLVFEDVVRKKATLTVVVGEGEERTLSGIVSRIEQGNPAPAWSEYRLTIVPWAWMLQHRLNSRIFQEMSTPAIVKQVLDGAGAAEGKAYAFAMQGTYALRDYCVQYRESDWDFVCRLLEEEGIFYYFDQTGATDKLVLADAVSAYPAIEGDATLLFRPSVGALAAPDVDNHVLRFNLSEELRAGKTTLRDWNFLKPSLSLETTASWSNDTGVEAYDYPGDYVVKGDGDTFVKVRLDELTAARVVGNADSLCPRLAAGATFTLSDHPRESFNAKYLVTSVRHSGTVAHMQGPEEDHDDRYRNAIELMPATVLFRPPRVTRRPQIHGMQTAIVVGPAGEEIYTDENGRVKVQFHWDRLGKSDEKSSCWIRVAQIWASGAFGAVFIPRIDDEVVVSFLEGNPDRPLIVGSVYHGTNVPPYALPGEKTKSTIKSRSTPKGDATTFNELRFEDKKGSEEVFLQAQKDWTILVKNDKNQKVGHDETLEIDNDRTKTVKHDQTGTVQHDDALTVQHDQTLTVQHDRSVTVQNDHTEAVSGNQSITITKAQTVKIDDKQDITVEKTRSLVVSDDVTESFSKKHTVTVGGDVSQTLQSKRTLNLTGDDAATIGGKQTTKITGNLDETVGGSRSMTVTGNVTITSGASTVTIKPSGEITIKGTQITIDADGPVKVHGAVLDVVADDAATLSAAIVSVSSDGKNTIKGTAITLDGDSISIG